MVGGREDDDEEGMLALKHNLTLGRNSLNALGSPFPTHNSLYSSLKSRLRGLLFPLSLNISTFKAYSHYSSSG